MSILVALHSGSLSGIDTYAEQVAAAAVRLGHSVTLVARGERAADLARTRTSTRLRVIQTGELGQAGFGGLARKVPTLQLAEMRRLLSSSLREIGETFDVAHLNHPALASAVRPHARRVVAGAWFYPHGPIGRMTESWRHTGGRFPWSAAFAVKGLAHYLNDRDGFRRCDAVAAPTELLARQLRARRVNAVMCPPPAGQPDPTHYQGPRARNSKRILICCGDLGHPRKNVVAGVRAVGTLARRGHATELVLVGRNVHALESELAALPWSVSVRAMGALPREEIHGWMESSDLLLLPSLYEEWGYVATESWMAGTPVATFPVYPFAEILSPPLGAVAGNMSPAALAAAIELILDSRHRRAEVRSAAIQQYGPEASARRLHSLWAGGPAEEAAIAISPERAMAQ